MRQSNRESILDAAIRVTNREGIRAVTFDSVAAEAGVTRGGMIYHFQSRDALIHAVNLRLAEMWEALLLSYVGKPSGETSAAERHKAYIQGSTHSATRAELLFLLEFSHDPELAAPWDRIIGAWAAPEPTDADDSQSMALFIARLAADGLWVHNYIANRSVNQAVKERVIAHLINGPSGPTAAPAIKPRQTRRSKTTGQ